MGSFVSGGVRPGGCGTQGESALCSFLWVEPAVPAYPAVSETRDDHQTCNEPCKASNEPFGGLFAGLSGILFCGHRLLQFR